MKKIIVGHIADIQERRSRIINIDSLEIAVFKLTDGTIRAIENRCPHKGGKLSEGIVCDVHVFCPLHDWKINLKDGLVQEPDEGCVTVYSIEVDGETGMIAIIVPEEGMIAS